MRSLGALALGLVVALAGFAALHYLSDWYSRPAWRIHKQQRGMARRLVDAYAEAITDLAVTLAGSKHVSLREEWQAHLLGDPGRALATWRKLRDASGFMLAGLSLRARDLGDLAWVPIDAILKSRLLSNLLMWLPTGTATLTFFRHGGISNVIGNAENVSAIAAACYAMIRVGRWWRRVKPPDPGSRRRSDQEGTE